MIQTTLASITPLSSPNLSPSRCVIDMRMPSARAPKCACSHTAPPAKLELNKAYVSMEYKLNCADDIFSWNDPKPVAPGDTRPEDAGLEGSRPEFKTVDELCVSKSL